MKQQEPNVKPFLAGMKDSVRYALRGEPTPLDEISASLRETRAENEDFIKLLESHHNAIEESIAVLTNSESRGDEKRFHLERFLKLVNMHGHAEEDTLYAALKASDVKQARLEGIAGQTEHAVAYELGETLQELNKGAVWSEELDAKSKVAATLVQNHINEEESMTFPVARNALGEDSLNELVDQYFDRCRQWFDGEGKTIH